jgi:hypothetical protein
MAHPCTVDPPRNSVGSVRGDLISGSTDMADLLDRPSTPLVEAVASVNHG